MDTKKWRVIYLMALSFCLFSIAHGQEKVRTLDYLQNTSNGKVVTVLRTQEDGSATQHDHEIHYRDELVIDQQRFRLAEGEFYEGNAQNIILTSRVTLRENGQMDRFIQTYDFTGEAIERIGALPLSEVNSFHILQHNKHVLVSDEYEGLGYEISLYDSSLKKIKSYRPFGEKGFTQSMDRFWGDEAAFVFFPVEESAKPKLVLLDSRSFDIRFEIDLDPTYTISQLILIGDFVLLKRHRSPAEQELVCFDAKGKLLWKKPEYLYAYEGMKDENTWYSFATDKKDYWFIQLETGNITPKRSIRELTGGQPIGANRWIDLSAVDDASHVVLLISGKDAPTATTYSHELFLFDHIRDNPRKYFSIDSEDRYLSLKALDSKVLLINSKNQIIH